MSLRLQFFYPTNFICLNFMANVISSHFSSSHTLSYFEVLMIVSFHLLIFQFISVKDKGSFKHMKYMYNDEF